MNSVFVCVCVLLQLVSDIIYKCKPAVCFHPVEQQCVRCKPLIHYFLCRDGHGSALMC